jgi:putative transcriptional regulator
MSITHHLDDSTLMSFAAGSLPATLSVVAAAHVASCQQCTKELRRMEQIGSALFAGLEPSALKGAAPVRALVGSESDTVEIAYRSFSGSTPVTEPTMALATDAMHTADAPAAPVSLQHIAMPGPLACLIGPDISSVEWKWLGFGVWQHRIKLSQSGSGDLRLLKINPGQKMPNHGHGGSELTFILDGSYTDKTGTYTAGDVADHGDDLEHVPIACPDHGCICLVAAERPAQFKAMIQRVLQPLTGM